MGVVGLIDKFLPFARCLTYREMSDSSEEETEKGVGNARTSKELSSFLAKVDEIGWVN